MRWRFLPFADPSQPLRRPFAEAQGFGLGLWLRASTEGQNDS